jgi:AcrR family transcriptional regulator
MPRPKSERAHSDVLDAAQALFAERGIEGTSMDAIAAVSGVSKATIYKHWPDKDALCLEVMVRIHGRDEPPADPDSGDLRTDLITVLGHKPPEKYAAVRDQITPHLMAYSARHPAFAQAWRSLALNSPRAQLRAVLERAVRRGDLPPTLDIDIASALLYGPLLYSWILKSLEGRTLPDGAHEIVIDTFLRSYALDRESPNRHAHPVRVRRTRRV